MQRELLNIQVAITKSTQILRERAIPFLSLLKRKGISMSTQAILEKFETIKITNESRITGEELAFCTAQQELYAKILAQHCYAFDVLQQLKNDCETFMQSVADNNEYHSAGCTYHHYSCDYMAINKEDFAKKQIDSIHKRFISIIINFFKDKYNVSIDRPEYETLLALRKPIEPELSFYGFRASDEEKQKYIAQKRAYEEALDAYWDSIINAELNYNAILDHIFVELDGSTFAERADQEIKKASRKATRNRRNRPSYEIKNKRIVMDILYPRKDLRDEYEVELDGEDYRAILRALTYFNSEKRQSEIYSGWHHFMEYRKKESEGIFNLHRVGSTKVLSFKYYKNGKFEVTFDAHTTAKEFAEEYLYSIEVEADD